MASEFEQVRHDSKLRRSIRHNKMMKFDLRTEPERLAEEEGGL